VTRDGLPVSGLFVGQVERWRLFDLPPTTGWNRVDAVSGDGLSQAGQGITGGRGTLGPVSHTVEAELVANVLEVCVEIGTVVAAEDPIVLLESMKMEIPVLAEVAGKVVDIRVAKGDVVNDGDPLAIIEPA
jgi:acetyl-CoA carboxylase biotin carboxyl carrier protein